MILTCADDGELATGLAWSSWTATQATAAGKVTWRACTSMCAKSTRFKSAKAKVTLTDPVAEPGEGVLFTKLTLHVTGKTPAGFLRNVTFSEAPMAASPVVPGFSPSAGPAGTQAPAAASGTLTYTDIEGFWRAAGGPAGNVSVAGGTFTQAQIAAAITGAESSFLPGIIQPGVDYCGAGADRAGWGLWQITCGNSVPQFGTNFQILDPWNNAEAAVAKFDAAGGFTPWATFTSGAYTRFLQHTGITTPTADPGEFVQVNATPPGTPASPPPDPGSTFGPLLPGAGVITAIQANTGIMWTDRNGTATNTGVAESPDAGPAIASSGGGFEIAVQSANHFLWTDANGTITNRELGMAEDTSPAIAALTTGGYEIAFQANTGHLWLVSPNGTATDTKQFMKAGTSPAITATSGGGFEVAYQADTGFLWLYAGGTATNTELGMAPLTSPAITALPNGGREVAFQANTGFLWTDINGTSANTELGMLANTSPSIADVGGVGYIAFQANTGRLWVDENGQGVNQGLPMSPQASPSITAVSGGFEVAVQQADHFLWGDTNGQSGASSLGMMEDTSPSITAIH